MPRTVRAILVVCLIALAGAAAAPAPASAAPTPAQIVNAQSRHLNVPWLAALSAPEPTRVVSSCWRPRLGHWNCNYVTWGWIGNVWLVEYVAHFRYTRAKGVVGYRGPSGGRKEQDIPGVFSGTHLHGFLVFLSFGAP